MSVCRPALKLYARPLRHGGPLMRRGWPTCPHVATSTPCALRFSILSAPRSRRCVCSIASSSRASSPHGGLTRCPTSRRCSKTVSLVSLTVGWTPLPTPWRTDEAAGPAFDPFAHKLVRHTMADYLNKIAAAKADIAQFKGEKEAFEQSNAPDDADEEELANWNYARDLERQARELKAEHKDALKELAKLERAAVKARATEADRQAAAEAKTALQPVFDRLASIETELVPYECTKAQLAEARARYRELTNTFV